MDVSWTSKQRCAFTGLVLQVSIHFRLFPLTVLIYMFLRISLNLTCLMCVYVYGYIYLYIAVLLKKDIKLDLFLSGFEKKKFSKKM